jgi:hypothetical protein
VVLSGIISMLVPILTVDAIETSPFTVKVSPSKVKFADPVGLFEEFL